MSLILASSSPRRKEILSKAGYDFKIIPSNYDEKLCNKKFKVDDVELCAMNKALDVKNKTKKDDIIIASDTVVVLNNIILGKPKDKKEAFKMLKALSNNTHFVLTSVCLIKNDKILKGSEKTFVTFRKLNDDEIINYIETKNPLDKAGSYGIQDKGFDFDLKIKGEIDNVIGFPIKLFKKLYSII